VPRGKRKAWFGGKEIHAPVYARGDLAANQTVPGPVIIEERETTIVILPGWRARIDASGCIMASREE
jgi:N-methylhydantoinase A